MTNIWADRVSRADRIEVAADTADGALAVENLIVGLVEALTSDVSIRTSDDMDMAAEMNMDDVRRTQNSCG